MKKIAQLAALFFLGGIVYANDTIPGKHIIFKTRAVTADGNISSGYLTMVNDSSITIAKVAVPFGTDNLRENISTHAYSDLSYLQMKRKGSIGRGAIYGALAGITIGVVMAVIEGNDPYIPPEEDLWGLGNALRMTTGE